MKKNVLFICIATLIVYPTFVGTAQKGKPVKKIDTVGIVKTIKADFAAIDAKRKSYSQFETEFFGNTNKGNLYKGFYEDKVLRMINCLYFAETGKTDQDCYVNPSGQVFFAYSKEWEYLKPVTEDPSGKTSGFSENWYYFHNEVLIKWVHAGKVVPAGSTEFIKKKSQLTEELKKFKSLLADRTKLRQVK